MAKTGLAQDERFQQHDTGTGHPERGQRLAAIAERCAARGYNEACVPIEVSAIEPDVVKKVHAPGYVDRLRKACDDGLPYIDVPDSAICKDSYNTALLAAGTCINAVDDVMAGKINNAFLAVRPPGHHAEHHRSMGFCMFNNIALAARHLQEKHGITRTLILDWDVHHGNGTQHTFERDPRVLFISLHGHPRFTFPGTGTEHERGLGEGDGHTINIPMLPPAGDEEYRKAFDHIILPELERYAPQFVLISAGFDAHALDPLAPLELPTESFGWMTDELVRVANNHAQGRLVSFLEGGYHLEALADCVDLHLARLMAA